MAVFQIVLIAFCFLARITNSILFIKIRHKSRIFVIQIIGVISYTMLAIANLIHADYGFYIAIGGSAFVGMASSVGESTILGYL